MVVPAECTLFDEEKLTCVLVGVGIAGCGWLGRLPTSNISSASPRGIARDLCGASIWIGSIGTGRA